MVAKICIFFGSFQLGLDKTCQKLILNVVLSLTARMTRMFPKVTVMPMRPKGISEPIT
jgi:hypothetical protein